MKHFPITEQSRVNQCPAVGASAIAPKGLGTDGYKPLMQNRRAPSIERLRDRDTAGHTLTFLRSPHELGTYPYNQWRGIAGGI